MKIDPNFNQTIETLQSLVNDGEKFAALSEAQRVQLLQLAGQLSRPSRLEQRQRNKAKNRVEHRLKSQLDRAARAKTGIRQARQSSIFIAPARVLTGATTNTTMASPAEALASANTAAANEPELQSPRNCYVCKAEYTKLHFFYDSMCMKCAELNYEKRFQSAPLNGQVALITGARLKIGYHAALMMLRAGAEVIVTTRFPADAAIRYAKESDAAEWSHRLHIYGLDLRHTPSVEIFCRLMQSRLKRLDILINNAAQTVRRPPGFYAHLMATEKKQFEELPASVQTLLQSYQDCKAELRERLALAAPPVSQQAATQTTPQAQSESSLMTTWQIRQPGVGLLASAELSQIPYSYDNSLRIADVFPAGKLDADLQQVDLRETNSWRLRLGEVPAPELIEVQLVNSIAPFVLCNELVKIMRKDNTGQKHIVNVTAMEGKFYRFTKTDRHPHTNMAKAALNMLTHTSAADLARDGIFMNAVDTGWVTDEDPAMLSLRKQAVHDFQPPLDIVDGAARICDPFFHGIRTGQHCFGKFLKDYMPVDW